MDNTVTCLLMVQKFTNLKQKILKLLQLHYAEETFQKIGQPIICKKLYLMVMFTILAIIMMVLMLMI